MFNSVPCIIACSGNSIPFDKKEGIDSRLKEVIQNNITVGCNYFDYFGCRTTLLTFVDGSEKANFYRKNIEWLHKIPLIIGRYSSVVAPKTLPNTILIPAGRYYHGKRALDCKYKICMSCKQTFSIYDKVERCPKCRCFVWQFGIFPNHLVSMFSLSLAIGLGFTKIFLIGSDCKEINGKTHFYQDLLKLDEIGGAKKFNGVGKRYNKKTKTSRYNTGTYHRPEYLNSDDTRFGSFKNWKEEGLEIYNVSPESALTIFPRITYDKFYSLIGDQKIDQKVIREEIKSYILDKCR